MGQEVDLYAEALALTPQEHDAALASAAVAKYGADAVAAHQQQVVEDADLDVFLAELDLEDAEETEDQEQIAHFQQVLDRRTWELTEARRWGSACVPSWRAALARAGLPRRACVWHALAARRGSGAPGGLFALPPGPVTAALA